MDSRKLRLKRQAPEARKDKPLLQKDYRGCLLPQDFNEQHSLEHKKQNHPQMNFQKAKFQKREKVVLLA